ncbi:MAG: prolyl aminopeptidase [Gammaproteobacteria bacterium]|nr:prolyl aminopeptidase [Gammaproteobacteria bacterium]
MLTYFPPIEPYQTGMLSVDKTHTLYWEQSGHPDGTPVLFLHGGPGSGTDPSHRRFFDPTQYRIILFDQRGCGQSLPFSALEQNTTWDLVQDIEKLRIHLQIEQWVVFGGSWGSTLALAYAETHPSRVKALIVRGIFLGRAEELHWFYQFGAHYLFPDEWEKFLAPIPLEQQSHLIQAYHEHLTSPDPIVRMRAAKSWAAWEAVTAKLQFDPMFYQQFTEDTHADALARIECHYFMNQLFFETDNWLLDHAHQLSGIPGAIIHGRYDVICPVQNAWKLHQAWPEASLEIIPDAGHAASEPGIVNALVGATNRFAKL